ncbi:hypothetical protein JXA70_05065 [candidate division KSB1 bacterium]|nr:hypothetical protein [candidate division KSB1 bacterium]
MLRTGLLIVVFFQLNALLAQPAQRISLVSGDSDSDHITLLAAESNDPFSREAQIRFHLADSAYVEVCIATFTGETIRHLLASDLKAGIHSLTWDGKDNDGQPVGSGVFIYKIQTSHVTRFATLAYLY